MFTKSTIVRIIRGIAPILSTVAPGLAARWLSKLFLTPMRHQRPGRELAWIEDASVGAVRFSDEIELPLYTWGEGPTVLLVHGWSGRGSQLAAIVQPLVAQGFRVVAFDAPGNGDAGGNESALPLFAEAIPVVAKHVGGIDAIYAHSLGAAATSIAIHNGLDVNRVVYIAPPENPEMYLYKTAEMLGFAPSIATRSLHALQARFGLTFSGMRGRVLGPKMSIPLLVIHDELDSEVAHKYGRLVASSWPDAQLMTTSGKGHARILRDQDVVSAAAEFLAGSPRLAAAI